MERDLLLPIAELEDKADVVFKVCGCCRSERVDNDAKDVGE